MEDSVEDMNFTNSFGTLNNCSGNITLNASSGCLGSEIKSNGGKQPGLSSTLLQVTEVLMTCMDITTVVSNGMLILLIYKATKMKDGPGRLLTNQALADGGVGLLWLMVYGFIYTTKNIETIKTAMYVQRLAMFILTAESVHTLAMTLFTLHIAICSPLHYQQQDKFLHVHLFIGISWFVNIGSWMFIFLTENFFIFERESILIILNVSKSNAWFVALVLTLGYVAPLVVIVVCYIRIKRCKNSTEHQEVQAQSITRKAVQQAQGVLVVSVIYLVTFLPLFVFGMIGHTAPVQSAMSENSLFVLTTILSLSNYLYVVVKLPLFLIGFKSYRRVVRNICCRKRFLASTRKPSTMERTSGQGTGSFASPVAAFDVSLERPSSSSGTGIEALEDMKKSTAYSRKPVMDMDRESQSQVTQSDLSDDRK